jgi:ribosome maturation factor RimP
MSEKKKNANINIAALVYDFAQPITARYGLELVDAEYVKEGGQWIVRVFIDRQEEPIDHQCCQLVSEALSDLLDEKDPIGTAYILEVSSPGIERPLKKEADFIRFAGETVLVSLYQPLAGQKQYQGILLGLEEGILKLKAADALVEIPFDKIAKTSLVAKF